MVAVRQVLVLRGCDGQCVLYVRHAPNGDSSNQPKLLSIKHNYDTNESPEKKQRKRNKKIDFSDDSTDYDETEMTEQEQ